MDVKPRVWDILFKAGTGAALVLGASFSSALGLGQISHSSWLGEPLFAQLEVLDPEHQYSPEDIRLRQIYAAEAAKLGVDIVATRFPLLTKVERKGDRLVVTLRSTDPVVEPFLNFMVALEWPTGKTYREYSLLLDPRGANIAPPVASPSEKSAPTPGGFQLQLERGDQAKQNSPVTVAAAPIPFVPSSSDEYWTVTAGQTVSQIAQKVRIDSNIQLQAVTNHLYQTNPQSFDGAINQLQVGTKLRLPSKIEYAQMPRRNQPTVQPVSSGQFLKPSAAPQRTTSSHEAEVNYQVQAGDTLSQVAQKMRQDPNQPLQQVIDEIYSQNPHAFTGDKHQLRVGADLSLQGDSAMPTRTASAANLDGSDFDSELPSQEEFEQTAGVSDTGQRLNGSLRLSDSGVNEDDLLSGKLPSQQDVPVARQIEMVSELTDKLNSENLELRQRIDSIESSDSIELLQDLVLLQSKQLEHFRQQLDQTLNLLDKQKGSGSLSKGLTALTADGADLAANEAAMPASVVTGEPVLAAPDVIETPDSSLSEATAESEKPATTEPKLALKPEEQQGKAGIIESEGLNQKLTESATDTGNTVETSPVQTIGQEAAQSSSLGAWLWGLLVIGLLGLLALFDWRRPGSLLRSKFQPQQIPEQTPEAFVPPKPSEPVVRVRPRSPQPDPALMAGVASEASSELDVQVPLKHEPLSEDLDLETDLHLDIDDVDLMVPITGIAKWNRKDIPMLDVEETEVDGQPLDEDDLSFDDFGLMNPISIDDLDIDLEEGLDQEFNLELPDDEDDQSQA